MGLMFPEVVHQEKAPPGRSQVAVRELRRELRYFAAGFIAAAAILEISKPDLDPLIFVGSSATVGLTLFFIAKYNKILG